MIYPKWKHHLTKESVIVANEYQDADLGPEWHDHPPVDTVTNSLTLDTGWDIPAAEVAPEPKPRKPGRPRKVQA